jgi:hypothetical protein
MYMNSRIILLFCLISLLFTTTGFGFSDGPKDIAHKYLEALFERRYEDAYAFSSAKEDEDSRFEKYDQWLANYFTPENLKVIRSKKSEDGSELVICTFQYSNANNARSTERVTIKLIESNGTPKVDGVRFSSASRRSAQQNQSHRPISRPNASAGNYNPVTIPPNNSSNSSGLVSSLMSNPGKVNQLMSMGPLMSMMGDPEVMDLVSDPKIQQLVNDPAVMSAILSGNLQSLSSDSRFQELTQDPKFQRIFQKYESQGSSVDMQGIINLLGK